MTTNGWGGARPGSGRKRISERYASQVESFYDLAAPTLPDRYAALDRLARGGFEQVVETWEPAGLVTVQKTLETSEGATRVTELAFPHLPPEQLVCVRRVVRVAAPDRKANEYLIDRVAGRPVATVEEQADGETVIRVEYED